MAWPSEIHEVIPLGLHGVEEGQLGSGRPGEVGVSRGETWRAGRAWKAALLDRKSVV